MQIFVSVLNKIFLFSALALFCVPARVFAGTEHYVAQFRAKVVPARIFTFVMPENGELEPLASARERLAAGAPVAFVNREKLREEAQALELRVASEKLMAEKEILALTRRREELEFLVGLTDEEREMIKKTDAATADERALALLDEEIRIAKEKQAASELRARKEFEAKRELHELKMPFAGRIEWHVARSGNAGEKIRLYSSAPVATVADDSAYFIAFTMTRADWSRLPAERLRARIDAGGNASLRGVFSHSRIEKKGNAEALVYFFKLPPETAADAEKLLGANCVAKLFYESETPLEILDKAELVCGSDASAFASWEELAAAKYPDRRIVFNGETSLALAPARDAESAGTPP